MDANGPTPATDAERLKQVLADAKKPLTAKQVKTAVGKLYPEGTKPKAKLSEAGVLAELEKAGVHKHPETKAGEPTYWHTAYVPPPPKPPLADSVRDALVAAPGPLVFKDVKAALKKADALVTTGSGKTTDDDIRAAIDELAGLGRCFRCDSGKGGEQRYWHRDELHALREAAVGMSTIPQPMNKLVAALKAEVKGVDPGFAEGVVRDLIGDGKLHEHPPATAKGGPLFGTTPPPPPPPWYESKAYKKPFEALVKAAAKVLSAGDRELSDILAAVRLQLDPAAEGTEPEPQPGKPLTADRVSELERLIVATVSAQKPVPIMSLADLRAALPADLRGPAFDAAVLRLARSHRVRIQKDAVPEERTPEQEAVFVKSEQGDLFTSISV